MNKVLEEIIRSGQITDMDGTVKSISVTSMSAEEGRLIQKAIRSIEAESCVEVGIGFGVASLWILDALKKTENTKLHGIDPYQELLARNAALINIERSGFNSLFSFYPEPAHLALAEMEKQKIKVDFAVIDGMHTFDHTLVDFFHVDRILKVGGIVVFDDTNWKSVQKAVSFVLNNRAYSVFDYVPYRYFKDVKQKLSKSVYNVLYRKQGIKKNLPDVSLFFPGKSDKITRGGCVALKKEADDSRFPNHFVQF